MHLLIKNGVPRVTVTSEKTKSVLAFEELVNVDICTIDPYNRTCVIENTQKENFHCPKSTTFTLQLPELIEDIIIHANNLELCIKNNNHTQPSFAIENYGLKNSVTFRENNFEEIVLVDHGEGRFDLSGQYVQNLTTKQGQKTTLVTRTASAPTCFICYDNDAAHTIQPCGHWGICNACASHGTFTTCPICRNAMNDLLKICIVYSSSKSGFSYSVFW